MKEQIQTLVKLQTIEIETIRLQSDLDAVDAKIADLDGELVDFQTSLDVQTADVEEMKKQYRSWESESKMGLPQIEKSKEKLRTVKTNKEYQALLKEIEELTKKNSMLEDEMLAFLDRIEASEKAIETRKHEYSQLESSVESEKESISQEAQDSQRRLAELKAAWAEVAGHVDPEVKAIYEAVRRKVMGAAIAPVRRAICQGCHMNIPPQLYNEVQRRDSLKICPHCQRIIYWESS